MGVRTVLRSLALHPIKWFLLQSGQDIISRQKYGYDAFLDIQRLGEAWKNPIKIFFDVGANDGATTQHARTRFADCRIFAFEPHPKTFQKLTEGVGHFDRTELVNVAMGSEVGRTTMYEYEMSVLNSLLPNAQFAVRFQK